MGALILTANDGRGKTQEKRGFKDAAGEYILDTDPKALSTEEEVLARAYARELKRLSGRKKPASSTSGSDRDQNKFDYDSFVSGGTIKVGDGNVIVPVSRLLGPSPSRSGTPAPGSATPAAPAPVPAPKPTPAAPKAPGSDTPSPAAPAIAYDASGDTCSLYWLNLLADGSVLAGNGLEGAVGGAIGFGVNFCFGDGRTRLDIGGGLSLRKDFANEVPTDLQPGDRETGVFERTTEDKIEITPKLVGRIMRAINKDVAVGGVIEVGPKIFVRNDTAHRPNGDKYGIQYCDGKGGGIAAGDVTPGGCTPIPDPAHALPGVDNSDTSKSAGAAANVRAGLAVEGKVLETKETSLYLTAECGAELSVGDTSRAGPYCQAGATLRWGGVTEASTTPAPAPRDGDGDGIPNGEDKCPGTLTGITVGKDGCEKAEEAAPPIVVTPPASQSREDARAAYGVWPTLNPNVARPDLTPGVAAGPLTIGSIEVTSAVPQKSTLAVFLDGNEIGTVPLQPTAPGTDHTTGITIPASVADGPHQVGLRIRRPGQAEVRYNDRPVTVSSKPKVAFASDPKTEQPSYSPYRREVPYLLVEVTTMIEGATITVGNTQVSGFNGKLDAGKNRIHLSVPGLRMTNDTAGATRGTHTVEVKLPGGETKTTQLVIGTSGLGASVQPQPPRRRPASQ